MANFVPIQIVAQLMAAYAPPGWCKLAIHGALHTGKVDLHALSGTFTAKLPSYLIQQDSILPPRIRAVNPAELIERYGITPEQIGSNDTIEVWKDVWSDEPKRLAIGWITFCEPWDWDEPRLLWDSFFIPADYIELFGYDDMHPEGEPDEALYYDATFSKLCLSIDDAESIAPMCDFAPHTVGSKRSAPVTKIGRPKGSGYESADEPLVRLIVAEKRDNPDLSVRELAEKYAPQAVGHGTLESKIKRLERRLRFVGS